MDKRPNWDEYFMDFAVLTARRSTCLRRQVGAVIVQDKHIIATGYNGTLSRPDTTERREESNTAESGKADASGSSLVFRQARSTNCAERCTQSRMPSFRRRRWVRV